MSTIHCKKSWRKTPPAWPDDAVLKYQGDGILFWHADRVNPTSSDDEDGIFRSAMELSYDFCSHAKEFSDNFPSTFRRMNHSPKTAPQGVRTYVLLVSNPLLYHCATVAYCLNQVYLDKYCVFLRQYIVPLRQYCACFPSSIYSGLSCIYYPIQ